MVKINEDILGMQKQCKSIKNMGHVAGFGCIYEISILLAFICF